MSNSSRTITSRLQRAMLEIAESSTATPQERLTAADMILKAKELAKNKDRTTSRKLPKLVRQYSNVLGTR